MRIAGPASRPPAMPDVAAALRGAVEMLGQRPALTGLRADGRREQGFASLAGWVSKGANLLALEFGLGPDSRVAIAGPAGWPLAAAALSTWWIGATIVAASGPHASSAQASILHVTADGTTAAAGERFWFGDGLDGTGSRQPASGEQWTDAVTPHGDRPPPAAHDGDLIALLDASGAAPSQRQLLDLFAADGGGVLGVVRTGDEDVMMRSDAAMLLAALALRPLVTGSATVIIDADDAARDANARAERIVRWHD
jgi:hypothetical protein